jgi:hypothetical protein
MFAYNEPLYHEYWYVLNPCVTENLLSCGHSCMFVCSEPVYHKKKPAVLWNQLYHKKTCCSVESVVCLYVLNLCITKKPAVLWTQAYVCTY